MKKIIFAFFLLASTVSVINAQDIITQKNGDEIKAKVLEVGANDVKYKKFGNESGPTYTLSKSEIFMIKYENGEKDMFEKTAATPATTSATTSAANSTANSSVRTISPSQNSNGNQNQNQNTLPKVAQERDSRKGYIGGGIGGAGLMKEYSDAAGGLQLNVNFGYLFSNNVGIAASFYNTSFDIEGYKNTSIGLTGLLAGPLFSTSMASGILDFDVRPGIGVAMGNVSSGSASVNSDDYIFSFGLGTSLRWNCSDYVSLSANMDYYYGKVFDLDLSSIGFSIGVNYRF
ncbi:hypothetical protein FACS189415_8000 [Bacteroidia bacterium]|nr:hypothetical protein FACS189426_10190 [Bacteroidia bacterium]GHU84507.1 hypothetical protein FACS189415_8000 [Bacteroidia bacterium]GHV70901.1 hypothetical protein FACS189420_3890 [Bacteroidia bacterium]